MCTLYTHANIYMLCTHMLVYMCWDLVHLNSSGHSGVSYQPLGSHLSISYVQCVCVCVYTHLHPHTLPPAVKIEKTQTTPLSLLLSKTTPHANQQVSSYADVHNTCLTYTAAPVWWSQHLLKCIHSFRKKCTCTRACVPMQQCRSFFAMEANAN